MKKRLLAMVMAAVMLWGSTANSLTANAATTPSGKDIGVMSFNVLTTSKQAITNEDPNTGEDRGEKFINMLGDNLPDSIGLQEVTSTWLSYIEDDVLGASYPGGATYAIAGKKSTSGSTLKSGSSEYSPILYRSDKYKVAEQGGYWMSATPDTSGSKYDSMKFARVFSYAVLKDRSTGEVVYVHVNVHTDHKSVAADDMLCVQQVVDTANDLSEKYDDCPVVFTGDYNMPEGHIGYEYMANGENGYIDAKYATDNYDPECTCAGYGDNYKPEAVDVIDHIFVSKGNVGVHSHDVLVDKYASDHSCVYARMVLSQVVEAETASAFSAGKNINGESASASAMAASGTTGMSVNVTNGNNYVGGTVNGSTATYEDVDFGDGGYTGVTFNMAFRSGRCGGTIEIYLKDTGAKIGYITIDKDDAVTGPNGNYKDYKQFQGVLTNDTITGKHDIELKFITDTYYVGNVDYFFFNNNKPLPVITEIYPNAEEGYRYFEVTNEGTTAFNTADYFFLWGNIKNESSRTWEGVYQPMDDSQNKMVEPGEKVIFWFTYGGSFDGSVPTVDEFNDHYGTDLSEDDIIISDPDEKLIGYAGGERGVGGDEAATFSMGSNKSRGMRVAKATQADGSYYKWETLSTNTRYTAPTVSISSTYTGSSLSSSQVIHFTYIPGSVQTTATFNTSPSID